MLPSAVHQLLPTPSAADGSGGHVNRSGDRKGELLLNGVARAQAQGALLPTPLTDPASHNGHGRNLSDEAKSLLPTPAARDWRNVGTPERAAEKQQDHAQPLPEVIVNLLPTPNGYHADVEARTGTRHGPALPVVALSVADGHPLIQAGQGPELVDPGPDPWGPYAAAIHGWEAITRPSPPPVEQGPKGGTRLSPAFVEWMMGQDEGHVTDVPGVTRNEKLKMLGNGVVRQQAVAALRFLLDAPG